jgi:iron complex outermembrane recepter protein
MKAPLLLAVIILVLGLPPPEAAAAQDPDSEEERPSVHEVVVVTAARREQRITDAVSLTALIPANEIINSPSLVLDDVLRQVPGFSLFRRSSSLAAHPTTQGVSLRGIGPSGASRTLVLFDGIPFNDPFGGWVYWNRIPLLALRGVEVVRGATSPLYGTSALGGTIQLLPRRPTADTLEFRGRMGSARTYDLDFYGSDTYQEMSYLVSGRVFTSDGFYLVGPQERGAIDRPADLDFQSFFGRFYYKGLRTGVNLFAENRVNGTSLQTNRSRIGLFEAGWEHTGWRWDFYTQLNSFQSTFSRILPDRSGEFLTADQDFPSNALGTSFTWNPAGSLLAGADWRRVAWDGRGQNLAGLFVQDLLSLHPRADLLLGVRFDLWENVRVQTGVNPRFGLLFRAADFMTLRSSGYRGFRAPTLNELYRPFRVGNVETMENPELDEEFLWGGEAGADFHPARFMLFRLNFFYNTLKDPVSNVTLSTSPDLILRQRQNLGGARVRGLETELALARERWRVTAAYLYSLARVEESGLLLPQVPRNQASLALEWTGFVHPLLQTRWVGSQFDDDRNQFRLGGYVLFDANVRRPITDTLDLFFTVENILNKNYAVGRTPVQQLGSPRMAYGGLYLRLR